MVRVLVVHDEGLLRSALVQLLRSDDALEVSSLCPRAGAPDHRAEPTDVCVVDGDRLEGSGAAYGASLRALCGDRLVVLAAPERPGVLHRAFDGGALGLVDKNASAQRLITAVHTVAKGERFLDETLTVALLKGARMPLTTRELSVVSLAAQGAPVAEIAARLHLSRGTVRNYMATAIRKVGARNRVDAIRIVQSAGWT
ncbi:response regulator transcription factor [Streptomyces griseomycini]|uniref:Two-component system response regulator DesR n=1 Tax=Streptomyces griseomycini TaxID=66895 RepID=A0A7W7M0E1_9ACTN|nr:response regulator transcription factor [Streptomyces griseomycini]MBB4899053.1 two-component system response regulator DesR [Streptomyces griseomycini]GGQ06338.1 DNA-binding response regulator [Streptomyces griseomycini]GGR21614.1 DNA-binding response regulator [Streptomyces griseomycini]